MTNRQKSRLFFILLIVIESFFYFTFVLSDICPAFKNPIPSDLLKYISISCLFLCSLSVAICSRATDAVILCIALFFTVIADYFLLFSSNFIPGILAFLVVQQFYLILVLRSDKYGYTGKSFVKALIIRLFISVILFVLLLAFAGMSTIKNNEILFIICILYGTCFILNVFQAFLYHSAALLKYGLLLFLLCDICVLLTNMPAYFELSGPFLHICRFIVPSLMWIFYLPGKLMISISVYRKIL